MSDKRDYYDVLGVARDATTQELKKSYRRLAMKYHPDQNPDDPSSAERFKELTEAYRILADPESRARYDRFGHQGIGGGMPGGVNMDMGSMTDFFESIFGSMFGGGGGASQRRRRGQAGRSLQYELSISLEQAVQGTELKITLPRPVRCAECGGSAAKKGTSPVLCQRCDGRGQILLQQGFFTMNTTCPSCRGVGQVIQEPCPTCHGNGLVESEHEYQISIPPGVSDGSVKVIPGGGEHGRGGAPDGDLNVIIRVEPHPLFERSGDDLFCVQVISWPQAVLGDELSVKTIHGQVKMKIKPGTNSGQVYVLRSKGVPHLRGGGNGDQHVRIDIDVPQKLNSKTRDLVQRLGEEMGTDVQSQHPSFLDRLKQLFA